KAARAHVEDASEWRGDSAEARKKLGKDQRTSALFREHALCAANAGIRLDRNFAKELKNFDTFAPAELIPERVRANRGERDNKKRSEDVHLMRTRQRACGEQQGKRRYGNTALFGENPREQDDVTVMKKKL